MKYTPALWYIVKNLESYIIQLLKLIKLMKIKRFVFVIAYINNFIYIIYEVWTWQNQKIQIWIYKWNFFSYNFKLKFRLLRIIKNYFIFILI